MRAARCDACDSCSLLRRLRVVGPLLLFVLLSYIGLFIAIKGEPRAARRPAGAATRGPDVGPPGPPGTIANSPPRARLSALVRSLGWSSEPCASRPGSRCTACAPRSADVAAASTTLRAARSSQPPRRCEALAPASPTSPFCTRSLGAADPWLLDGTETAARKAECARFGAAALACIALLMSRDRGGMEPRQWCDAERRSRNARDASGHLLALVGLLRHRAMHEYALCAMLAVGSEAPRATRARVCAALVGRVRACRPPQRGCRKDPWRA